MALPKAVEEQKTMAEQLEAQWAGQQNTDDRDPEQPTEAPPQPDGEVVEPEVEQPATTDEHGEDYWQGRFNTLQGKYNAEVPRLTQQNRDLQEQLQAANERVEEAERKLEDAQANEPVDLTTLFTPEEIERHGEAELRMMYRAGRHATQSDLDRIRKEHQQTVESLKQEHEASAKQQFMRDLTAAVPDWETINEDQRFHTWLADDSGYVDDSGNPLTKQDMLNRYHGALNVRPVIAIFDAYKKAIEDSRQAPKEAPPKVNTAPAQPDQGQGEWVTNAEIDEFYRTYARLKQYDPQECAAREKRIERAVAAGRVR